MKKCVPLHASIRLAIGLLFVLAVSGSQSRAQEAIERLR